MNSFTPGSSFVGGLLIGLAAVFVFWSQGKIAGVSGIAGGVFDPRRGDVAWRVAFVVGLVLVGLVGARVSPAHFSVAGAPSLPLIAVAGLLVGFGTRLSNGCTSGHGVCGLSRLSRRSMVATVTFMLVAGVVTYAMRHIGGE